ncbi:MAG: M20/M25/M40 family metallo-hydrolase [Clostridia bacterium]|nr:M20/M25/M40 family metallo-hydrolase [Clostridia bacterium]
MEFLQKYGLLLIVGLIVLICAGFMLLRMRRLRRRTACLKEAAPDPAIMERAAETLSQLISFKTLSVSEEDSEFVRQNVYIRERFHLLCSRLSVSAVDGRGLLCRWKGADESLRPVLFCAHTDVVPAGAGWSHEPFAGTRENGYIYGRGAVDCKGPAVALLEAVEHLLASGFSPRRDVYFELGYDEETGAKLGAGRMAKYFREKGIEFEMVLDEGDPVMESSPWTAQPAAFVDVAEKGVVTMRITAYAQPGHASRPSARSCAAELAEAVARIETAKFRPRLTRTTRAFFRELAPYMNPLDKFLYANFWLFRPLLLHKICRDPYKNAILRSTAAVTMLYGGKAPNVLPEKLEAIVSIRVLQGQNTDDIISFYRTLLSGLEVELTIDKDSEPSAESDADSHYFRTVSRTVREHFGDIPVIPSLLASATDGRKFEGIAQQVYSFVPLRLSAEELSAAHGPEERIPVAELGRAVEFYRDLIVALQS